MRIAFYNVQNLFFRHKDLITQSKSKCLNNWIGEMDQLVRIPRKGIEIVERMKELSFLLGFERKDPTRFALLRRKGASFYLRADNAPLQGPAGPNNSWNGWIEVENRPINPGSIAHKARVISDADADILLLQEVEDRRSLEYFNRHILSEYPLRTYSDIALLQGKDGRNIEQAVLVRQGVIIRKVVLNKDLSTKSGKSLFERGMLTYHITNSKGGDLWVILAQLQQTEKSKEESDQKRLEQSRTIAAVYEDLRKKGYGNIIVAGTFYAAPYCFSLAPVLQQTDLQNICAHSRFTAVKDTGDSKDYYSLGSYQRGINIRQQDYMLLSPELTRQVRATGLNRSGIWPGSKKQWQVYGSFKKESDQASIHPLLWVDVDI